MSDNRGLCDAHGCKSKADYRALWLGCLHDMHFCRAHGREAVRQGEKNNAVVVLRPLPGSLGCCADGKREEEG